MCDNLETKDNDGEYYSYKDYGDVFMFMMYSEEYKNSIPGYLIFCKDEKEKNQKITEYELGYNWYKLKTNNFEKYIYYTLLN